MTATTQTPAACSPRPRIGPVHAFALAAVWVTFAASGIVFIEPAPIDALMLGLLIALPVVGLVRVTPPLLLYLTIWLVAASCALVGTMYAVDAKVATTHALVTLFLTLTSTVVSAFVMYRPVRHAHLILHAWSTAALVAAVAALAGYFRLFPGAYELFTRFDRASGTFKDPNVFGAFLVPPLVYLLHRMLTRRGLGTVAAAVPAGLIALAILTSFSRGAWINLGVSVGIFGVLAFLTAPTNLQRLKILSAGFVGVCMALVFLVAALQIDGVGDQLTSRASFDQSYDAGPEGRFGGQHKAMRVILDNPLGIGAQQFAPQYHLEEPHNVYLFTFLNGGWLGGLLFAIMIAVTALYGLRHAFKRTATQPLFLVVIACFIALAGEGFVIDLDHWRHFHVLMALVWGLMLGDRVMAQAAAATGVSRMSNLHAGLTTRLEPRPLMRLPGVGAAPVPVRTAPPRQARRARQR